MPQLKLNFNFGSQMYNSFHLINTYSKINQIDDNDKKLPIVQCESTTKN